MSPDTFRTVTESYDVILMSMIWTLLVIAEFVGSYHFQFGHCYTSNMVLSPANIVSHFLTTLNGVTT